MPIAAGEQAMSPQHDDIERRVRRVVLADALPRFQREAQDTTLRIDNSGSEFGTLSVNLRSSSSCIVFIVNSLSEPISMLNPSARCDLSFRPGPPVDRCRARFDS